MRRLWYAIIGLGCVILGGLAWLGLSMAQQPIRDAPARPTQPIRDPEPTRQPMRDAPAAPLPQQPIGDPPRGAPPPPPPPAGTPR